MNEYHILFYEKDGDYYSKGENFEATSPNDAYDQWREKYPEGVWLSSFSKDLKNFKVIH